MKNPYMRFVSIFVFTFCICFLTACEKESKEEVAVPGGYKPVIYYHEELYWLSYDRPFDELPSGYHDSMDTITHAVADAYELPKEECETSAVNTEYVGATIYVHETEDKNIIISKDNAIFIVFEKDQEQHTE